MNRPSYGFAAPCPVCVEDEEARSRRFANAYQPRPLGLYSSDEALARHQFRSHPRQPQGGVR